MKSKDKRDQKPTGSMPSIKVRPIAQNERQAKNAWLSMSSPDYTGRHMLIPVGKIESVETVYWYRGNPGCWDLPASPLPDDDHTHTPHCAITLPGSIVVTQETMAEIERLIDEARGADNDQRGV